MSDQVRWHERSAWGGGCSTGQWISYLTIGFARQTHLACAEGARLRFVMPLRRDGGCTVGAPPNLCHTLEKRTPQ